MPVNCVHNFLSLCDHQWLVNTVFELLIGYKQA
jgi:hypothetical protein